MNRTKINIGLFGFGCVGFGLYEVLQKTPSFKANIKRICVKNKHKKRPINAEYFTFDKFEILNDQEINTIVELIDDAEEAFEIVKLALQNGKAVVTANKKMIAEHFDELLALQKKFNVPVLYEAACCASIPIIRNLEEYYDNDLLESIEGIVNGSTNYILTKTASEDISYQKALADAQQKGYAESKPILDTSGLDAKYKLLILIAHAFGVVLKPEDIFNIGIDKLGELEFNYAKEKKLKIKLIAHAEKTDDGKLKAFVMPKFISESDNFFYVDGVFNGIKTKTFFSDLQFFSGKGAGAYPTASAVLSDISALSYNYQYEYKKIHKTEVLAKTDDVILKVFLRHDLPSSFELRHYFEVVNESYLNQDSGFIIGNISLENMKKLSLDDALVTSFVLIEIVNSKWENRKFDVINESGKAVK
ncbi:MAG: homoserine dehydrogenase [Bacteroidota bacterium]